MPFLQHLLELRRRLIYTIAGVGVAFLLTYSYSEKIFNFLLKPLCKAFQGKEQCPIIYQSVVEPFLVYLKIGILSALFLASPWIFFQIWGFIRPGLHANERRFVVPFVSVATVMFVGGALLGYFFIFPFAFDFFLHQAPQPIQPMLGMSDYYDFASGLMLAFGLLFEIPVFVFLLNLIGVLKAKTLWRTWRPTVAVIFILSAVLTPADPYTMLLLGVPLASFYILALIACSVQEKLRSKKQKTEGVDNDPKRWTEVA